MLGEARKLAIYLELERELARPHPIQERAEVLARKARRQLERQREIWRFQHEPELLCSVPPGWRGTKIHYVLGAFAVLEVLSWMLLGMFGVLAGIVFVIFALVGWNVRMQEHERERMRRLDRCRCCKYDLAGLDSSVALDALGVELGTRKCPECGVDWPAAPELRFDPWEANPRAFA